MSFENVELNLGTHEDCGHCAHEFLTTEYDKATDMIFKLSEYKLTYQKMFITLFAGMGTVSLALLKLDPTVSSQGAPVTVVANSIGITHLVGLLLIGTSLLGFVLLKNLASTRISELFFARSIRAIRLLYISKLELPANYPKLRNIKVLERTSADYHMMVACSLFNDIFFTVGSVLLFHFNNNLIGNVFIAIGAFAIYLILHIFLVERYMARGDQKFSFKPLQ